MIRTTLMCLLALLGVASADTKRKAAPDKFARAAGQAFAKAVEAQDRGRPDIALSHYQTSLELAPHPNTVFNIAALHAARGAVRDALIHYEMYLALAPDAPDRAAVQAAIKGLRERRGVLWIHAARADDILDLAEAYILVDGAIVSKPGALKGPARQTGIKLPLAPGRHQVDVISPITYASKDFTTDYGEDHEVPVSGNRPADGNVAGHTTFEMDLTVGRERLQPSRLRTKVAPGKYWARVYDRGHECPEIEIDVPKGDSVVYLHVTPAELLTVPSDGPKHCRKLTIARRVLAF